jgi:hypothetical protein
VVTAQDIDWLVAHLQTVVAASPVVWAGRGMTLLQLTALHLISALAPVTLTDLAQALGTRPCPVDHGTGSRSQMRIEVTSTVPAKM